MSVGVGGKLKRVTLSIGIGTELLCLQKAQRQQQSMCYGKAVVASSFDTACSLISAPQWHRIPHSGPS